MSGNIRMIRINILIAKAKKSLEYMRILRISMRMKKNIRMANILFNMALQG